MWATREASAEIARGGGIGDALGAQSVEIIDIVASQFDVLQAIAVAQGVEGEVEDMIGFVIGQTDLENAEALVDGVDEADVAGQLVEERDAAIAQAVDAFGDFIAEIAAGQDRAQTSWETWSCRGGVGFCACWRPVVGVI